MLDGLAPTVAYEEDSQQQAKLCGEFLRMHVDNCLR